MAFRFKNVARMYLQAKPGRAIGLPLGKTVRQCAKKFMGPQNVAGSILRQQ